MKTLLACFTVFSIVAHPTKEEVRQPISAKVGSIPVVAIGASLAAGTSPVIARVNGAVEHFDDIYQYPDVLAAIEPAWHVETFANMMFFSRPIEDGQAYVSKAVESPRRVVLALDYLFWFGYGDEYADASSPAASRLEFLKREGFTRLEQLWSGLPEDAPPPYLLVGTFPDVRDSAALQDSQKPSDQELADLNAAVLTWAAQHPHVLIVPYAERLATLKKGGTIQLGTQTLSKRDLSRLLLSDGLHPTSMGSVMIAALCIQTLKEALDEHAGLLPNVTGALDLRALTYELMAVRRRARQEAQQSR